MNGNTLSATHPSPPPLCPFCHSTSSMQLWEPWQNYSVCRRLKTSSIHAAVLTPSSLPPPSFSSPSQSFPSPTREVPSSPPTVRQSSPHSLARIDSWFIIRRLPDSTFILPALRERERHCKRGIRWEWEREKERIKERKKERKTERKRLHQLKGIHKSWPPFCCSIHLMFVYSTSVLPSSSLSTHASRGETRHVGNLLADNGRQLLTLLKSFMSRISSAGSPLSPFPHVPCLLHAEPDKHSLALTLPLSLACLLACSPSLPTSLKPPPPFPSLALTQTQARN